jgi:hypothetical protein
MIGRSSAESLAIGCENPVYHMPSRGSLVERRRHVVGSANEIGRRCNLASVFKDGCKGRVGAKRNYSRVPDFSQLSTQGREFVMRSRVVHLVFSRSHFSLVYTTIGMTSAKYNVNELVRR